MSKDKKTRIILRQLRKRLNGHVRDLQTELINEHGLKLETWEKQKYTGPELLGFLTDKKPEHWTTVTIEAEDLNILWDLYDFIDDLDTMLEELT